MKVHILGGGVNGLCSAYYLQKLGFHVTVIDPTFNEEGTSYGNAGMIVPSHFIPLASPGVIAKGIKWMFDSSSPFYIKPRMDLSLAQWLWKFYRSCTKENIQNTARLIWDYNELSKSLYREIVKEESIDVDFHERGLMMLFRNEKSKAEEIEVAGKALKMGLEVQILDKSGVQKLNPDTEVDVLGGIFYPGDAHLYSNQFMQEIKEVLEAKGVEFIEGRVMEIRGSDGAVHKLVMKGKSEIEVDQLVITAGAWTAKILKSIGVNLLLQDGKGYSITIRNTEERPTIPSILTDEKVAITPMGRDLRITGTMEISGNSTGINMKRVNGFLNAVPRYFPQIKIPNGSLEHQIWKGYRPLSPDGLPYVGKIPKYHNLVVATGHGMMGMSMGPATGKLVSEIISDTPTSIAVEQMRPVR